MFELMFYSLLFIFMLYLDVFFVICLCTSTITILNGWRLICISLREKVLQALYINCRVCLQLSVPGYWPADDPAEGLNGYIKPSHSLDDCGSCTEGTSPFILYCYAMFKYIRTCGMGGRIHPLIEGARWYNLTISTYSLTHSHIYYTLTGAI